MYKAPTPKQSCYCLQIDATIQATGEKLPNPNCLDILPWFGLKIQNVFIFGFHDMQMDFPRDLLHVELKPQKNKRQTRF